MAAEPTIPAPPAEPSRAHPSAFRNVLANWGGFLFSAAVNFFLAPFVVRHLGDSLYGVSVLILSVTGYLGMLDLGVRGAMTRYVARYWARSEHAETSRFASAALAVFVAAGLLAVCFSLALAPWADSLHIANFSPAWMRLLFVLCGLNVAASLVSGVFSGIPMALQRFDYVNGIVVLSMTFRALAIVLALRAGGGLMALVFIQLVYTLGATLASARLSFRLYPDLRIRFARPEAQHIALILSFCAYSFVLLVFDVVLMYASSVVVGALLSASMVTFFWIAASLINYSRALLSGISKLSAPLASALEAQDDQAGLQRAVVSGARYSTLLILPVAVTFMLRGSEFIGLWMGPQYADLSGRVLWVLALGLAFSAGNQVALATMLGISKHKLLVPVFLVQAFCTLALSAGLIPAWGVTGVAWAITLAYLAVSLVFWPWYVRRCLGVPVPSYWFSVWVRPVLGALPSAVGTYAVTLLWPARSLLVFFLQTGALLPLALLGFWYLSLTRAEQQRVSAAVPQPLSKILGLASKRQMETWR